jgi:hypothetical protein
VCLLCEWVEFCGIALAGTFWPAHDLAMPNVKKGETPSTDVAAPRC